MGALRALDDERTNDMKRFLSAIAVICLATGLGVLSASPAVAQEATTAKVVYHFDDASLQALRGLRSIRNHLDTAPGTQVAIVAHANGVDMFMEGATDAQSGVVYAPLIADLKSRGVDIYICEITLAGRGLSPDAFILEADFTPSGVVALTELQQTQGHAYIKP